MPSFQFQVLSFLFVSFRPSLFRSHSRSTGAHVQSASFPSLPFRVFSCRPLPFVRVRFRARLLSLCFFLSLLHAFPSQWFPHCASVPVSVSGLHLLFPFPVPAYPRSLSLFPCLVLRFGTQLRCDSFQLHSSPHSCFLLCMTFVPRCRFPLGPSP